MAEVSSFITILSFSLSYLQSSSYRISAQWLSTSAILLWLAVALCLSHPFHKSSSKLIRQFSFFSSSSPSSLMDSSLAPFLFCSLIYTLCHTCNSYPMPNTTCCIFLAFFQRVALPISTIAPNASALIQSNSASLLFLTHQTISVLFCSHVEYLIPNFLSSHFPIGCVIQFDDYIIS